MPNKLYIFSEHIIDNFTNFLDPEQIAGKMRGLHLEMSNLLLSRRKRKLEVFQQISQWYQISNTKFVNHVQLSRLESDIEQFFSEKRNMSLTIPISTRFRASILKNKQVIQKFARHQDLYKKCSQFLMTDIKLRVQLIEAAQGYRYPFSRYPYRLFWQILRNNLHDYLSIKKSWEDIEWPFLVLCSLYGRY